MIRSFPLSVHFDESSSSIIGALRVREQKLEDHNLIVCLSRRLMQMQKTSFSVIAVPSRPPPRPLLVYGQVEELARDPLNVESLQNVNGQVQSEIGQKGLLQVVRSCLNLD